MSYDLTDPNVELARAVEATRSVEQNDRLTAEVASMEERLSDASTYVSMADTNIAQLENVLKGWKRFRAYQAQRKDILSRRIVLSREEVRLNEDYEGQP